MEAGVLSQERVRYSLAPGLGFLDTRGHPTPALLPF